MCIEKEDYEKQILRLKDFADIEITSDLAKITSIEKSDSRPIVHWLSAKNANQGLLVLPNEDSIQFISGMIEDNDYQRGHLSKSKGLVMVKWLIQPQFYSAINDYSYPKAV